MPNFLAFVNILLFRLFVFYRATSWTAKQSEPVRAAVCRHFYLNLCFLQMKFH